MVLASGLGNKARENGAGKTMGSHIPNDLVWKIRMNWGQASTRQCTATENAWETNCLVHSGTGVPAISQALDI